MFKSLSFLGMLQDIEPYMEKGLKVEQRRKRMNAGITTEVIKNLGKMTDKFEESFEYRAHECT